MNDMKNDPVNHPSHYNMGKIEVSDFIADQKLNFDRGNAVKYIVRAGHKDSDKEVQDLRKAIWYINHEIRKLTDEMMDGIKIKYHADIPKIEKIPQGDWMDLRAAEDYVMKRGEYKVMSLGVSMKLPAGYEAHILPRSSTFKTWGILLVNGMGVIDESYSGTNDVWGFPAVALRDTVIHKGDRICQFRIVKKMDSVTFQEVEGLDNQDRGGYGSTGKD